MIYDANMTSEGTLSVIPKLRMMRPDLSEREQKIVNYLLENSETADAWRISDLAAQFDVSEAMIVKLAKRLGFSGFRALKANLVAYNSSRVAGLFEEVSPEDSPATIVRKLFRASIQALEETLAIIDMEQFDKAVDLFVRSGVRDIYGVGGSAAIARDAAHKFLRIGMRCNCFDDAHLMAMSGSILTPQDVVLAVSHSGQTSVILDAVRIARERGARVIALTSYQNSPLAQLADAGLISTARSSPYSGENAAARLAQLNLIDALFVSVAFQNQTIASEKLSLTMSAVEEKREK